MNRIMKKICIILSVLLISSDIFSSTDNPDVNVRLAQLRKEVFTNLTQNILPFWSEFMIDNRNGGYYGRIDVNNKIYPREDKGGILNARILWTYSAAYRVLKDTSCLRLAKRARDYILEHFIDRQYGGAYRSLKFNGDPSDTRKQIYTESFFIYAFTEYYRAAGDKTSLNNAIELYNLIEKNARDKNNDGYYEVFTRDWHRSHDLLIGESTANDEKTMNTHLHLMEAYTNLYRVWPDKQLAERLKKLTQIFLNKITDPETSHLICFMDKSWKRTSPVDSYGHDIESSWLLYETAILLDDKELLSTVKTKCLRIARAAEEGLQPDGSLIYESNHMTGTKNTERSWWAQAEAIVGYLNAFELSGDEHYLDKSVSCWNYTKTHLVDSKSGGWFSSVSETGRPGTGDKGGFWVCPYHNSRMCLELIERLSSN